MTGFWDNSKGGKSSFKWVIRASTKQKEEVGISLGPKNSEAHCVSISSPMSTRPCHLEVGECSNSFLGPIPPTSYPDGLEENPTVSPSGLMAPIEMLRSENDGSFSVSQLHVVFPATAMQTDADEGLLAQPWCASPVEVSGCTEHLQHMIFRYGSDRNSILGSIRWSGGLVSEDMRSVTREFRATNGWIFFPQSFSRIFASWVNGFWRIG